MPSHPSRRRATRRPIQKKTLATSGGHSRKLVSTQVPRNHRSNFMTDMTPQPDTLTHSFQPLSKSDVARALGVCVRTVESWVNAGEIPPPAKIGARVYWHPRTFYAWLDKRLQVPAPIEPSVSTHPDTAKAPHRTATPAREARVRSTPRSSAAARAQERSTRFLAALNAD